MRLIRPFRPPRRALRAPAALVVVLVAACGGAAAPTVVPATAVPATPVNPTPVIATPVNPTPVIPTPSSSASTAGYWLRMTTWQAIPPVNLFAVGATDVITGDGVLVTPGVVPAIFPGPQVGPLIGRQVSEAGRTTIMSWATELGLLGGQTDFTGGGGLPGGVTGHIELTVEGQLVTLTGIPGTQVTNPEPGSPEAFGELWRRIESLWQTLPGELGPEAPYPPDAYALLVGPPPDQQAGMTAPPMDWPLDTPLATLGDPVANGTMRCGLVEGADAQTLRPSLEQANQLTQWVQDPTTSATFGLTVRPLVKGENPCREVFGPA